MTDMWTTLQTMEDETFLKIVLGTADITEFDTFVAQWHMLGGDDIIAEIEAMIG
jgi:putative aldouronate transport system substrate-binding protein